MKKSLLKKSLAMFLVVLMSVTSIPLSVFAEDSLGVLDLQTSVEQLLLDAQNNELTTNYSGNTKNEFGMEETIPNDFNANDGEHPYLKPGIDSVENPWLNLNPINELVMFEPQGSLAYINIYNYNAVDPLNPSNSFANPYDSTGVSLFNDGSVDGLDGRWYYNSQNGLLRQEGNAGDTGGATTTTNGSYLHNTNYNNNLQHMSGVALDPTGSGQDDYVAYLGFDSSRGYLPTFLSMPADQTNLAAATRQYLNLDPNAFAHMNDLQPYEVEGYADIIAGDFDGDGKDSVILYEPTYKYYTIQELSMSDNGQWGRTSYDYMSNRNSVAPMFSPSLYDTFADMFEVSATTLTDADDKSTDSFAHDNVPMVHLAAGDLTEDGKDELVITISIPNTDDETDVRFDQQKASRGSAVLVYEHINGKFNLISSYNLNVIHVEGLENSHDSTGANSWYMRSAASSIGDVDGDGLNEITTVGTFGNHIRSGDDDIASDLGLLAVVTHRGSDGRFSLQGGVATGSNGRYVNFGHQLSLNANGGSRTAPQLPSSKANLAPMSLATVAFDGLGSQEYVVARGAIFRYDSGINKFVPASFAEHPNVSMIFDGGTDHISHPTVGNFGGKSGEESVLFVTRQIYDQTGNYNVVGYTRAQSADDTTQPQVMKGDLLSSQFKTSSNYHGSMPVLTAADYDDDVTLIRYADKQYKYTDPEVMAIMEVAPYYKELEYTSSDTASTTFGVSKTEGDGSSGEHSISAGVYVGFDIEDLTGVFENSGTTHFEFHYTYSTEEIITKTNEMDFSTGAGDDHQVVMISVPVISYRYETKLPTGVRASDMYVQVPQTPIYGTIDVTAYNEIADASNGIYHTIPVGNDANAILTSTPGNPRTYRDPLTTALPTLPDGTYPKFDTYDTNYVEAGSGSNVISQRITRSEESNTETDYAFSVNGEVGQVRGGFAFGATAGYQYEDGTLSIDASAVTREGSVASVPDYAADDYRFNWQFITWDAPFVNSQGEDYTVPVLSYNVRGEESPPLPPYGLTAVAESESSIKLTWEHDGSADTVYDIYLVHTTGIGNEFIEASAANAREHIVTGLDSGAQYTFYIVAREGSSKSYPSNEASSYTYANAEGSGIDITAQPVNDYVFVGENATFSVTAVNTENAEQGLNYQWQVLRPGIDNAWTNIDGEKAATLDINSVVASQAEYSYRCQITRSRASIFTPVYTSTAKIIVKPDRAIDLEVTLFEYADVLAGQTNDVDALANLATPVLPVTEIVSGDYYLLNVMATYGDAPYAGSGDPAQGEPINNLYLSHRAWNSEGAQAYGYANTTRDGVTDSEWNGISILEGSTFFVAGTGDNTTLPLAAGYYFNIQVPKVIGLQETVSNNLTFNVTSGHQLNGLANSYEYKDPITGVSLTDKDGANITFTNKIAIFNAAGTEVADLSTGELTDTSALLPGTYTVRGYNTDVKVLSDPEDPTSALVDLQVAEKEITVTKKVIEVVAPEYTTEIPLADIGSFTTNELITVHLPRTAEGQPVGAEFDLDDADFGTAADGYASIFSLTVSQQIDGYYLVPSLKAELAGANGAAVADFQNKYAPEFQRSAKLNVTGLELHKVEYGVAVIGSGSISANASIGGIFASGTEIFGGSNVTFNAQGVAGSAPTITGWTVNGNPITDANMADYGMTSINDADLTITGLDAAANVVVSVDTPTYPVTINGSRSQTTGADNYESGATVTIYAGNPESGYKFNGWVGNIAPADISATTTTFTMPAHAVNLTATWESTTQFDVTVNGSQGVTTTGEGTYLAGARVDIDAGSLAGYNFGGWQASGITLANPDDAQTSFTMPSNDVDLLATWVSTAQGAYTVTVVDSYDPFSGAGKYDRNGMVTLKAGTREGYTFDGWTIDNQSVTIIDPTAVTTFFSMPATDVKVTANWRQSSNPTPNPNPNPDPAPPPDPDPNEEETVITIIEIREIIRESIVENREVIIIDSPTPITRFPVEIFTEAMDFGEIIINTPAASIGIANESFGSLASLGGEITVYASVKDNQDGTATADLSVLVNGTALREVPGGLSIAFPFTNGSHTTVAKLLYADGTYGIIPKSIASVDMMSIHLKGPSSLLIEDNFYSFVDISSDYWAAEDIAFVSSHGLFLGVAPNIFDSTASMSRSMLWTVLARMEGEDTEGGLTWYSKGRDWAIANDISNGSEPDSDISRESLVTMLWRTAGSPIPSTDASSSFSDHHQVSEYAKVAMDWAIEVGIINGKTSDTIDPLGGAIRAEVSAILRRFMVLHY